MQTSNKKLGFTLIELLIVIVIIGILAGVVLAVINPQRMIQRSQHATLRGSVSKVCMALYACAGSNSTIAGCNTAANLGISLPDTRVSVTYPAAVATSGSVVATGTEVNGNCRYSCQIDFAAATGWTTIPMTVPASYSCLD